MSLKRRLFTKEFKQQVLREREAGKSVAQAAREHPLHPNCLGEWRRQAARHGEKAFAGQGNAYKDDGKVAQLERLLGEQTIEIAFLKRALTHFEARQSELTSPRPTGGKP